MKYVTKPVEVEAWRIEHVESASHADSRHLLFLSDSGCVYARAQQLGNHEPKPGDYWIRLSEADQYLCPKDVFERKYQKA